MTTPFLLAYGVALLGAVVRSAVLYAAGLALAAGATNRVGRVADRLTRGHAEQGAERVRSRGALGVARAYLVPGLSEATQVMAGMSGMPLRTFIGGLAPVAIPWAVVDATIGSSILVAAASGWGVLVLGAVVAGVLVHRNRHRVRTHVAPAPLGTVTMAA